MSFRLQTMPWKWPRVRDTDDATVSTQVSSWLNFTPQTLPGLQLWLDAADTSTITQSGGAVSQWKDKSGKENNFAQATSANQPTTGINTQNGLNVITFDGGNDFLGLGTNDLGRNVTGATIYIVLKHDSNPATQRVIFNINKGDATNFARFIFDDGLVSQRARVGGRTLDADAFASVSASAVIGTAYSYRTGVFDYANTDLFNYINGVVDGSTTSFQTATTTSDTASLLARIGASLATPVGSTFFGKVAEILVYHTAHTTTQRVTVETYLKTKWGL